MDQPVPLESFSEDGPDGGGTGDTGGDHGGETSDTGEDFCDEDCAHYVAYLLNGAESPRPLVPFVMETREGGNYSEGLRLIQQVQFGKPNGEIFFVTKVPERLGQISYNSRT